MGPNTGLWHHELVLSKRKTHAIKSESRAQTTNRDRLIFKALQDSASIENGVLDGETFDTED
jgi:hypothetical protein